MISIIVAYDPNRTIGNGRDIPWSIPEDMKHFKKTTVGNVVKMGRKTWDSIPEKYRPLPDRENIILTRDPEDFMSRNLDLPSNVHVSNDLEMILDWAIIKWPDKEIFITGGGEVYKLALEVGRVDRVIASEVDVPAEGDVKFPELPGEWEAFSTTEYEDFDVVEYQRYN